MNCDPKKHIQVLTLLPVKVTCFANRVLVNAIELRICVTWIRVGLECRDCAIERKERRLETQREGGRLALGREGVWSTPPGSKDCQPLKTLGRGLGQSRPQTPSGNQCC